MASTEAQENFMIIISKKIDSNQMEMTFDIFSFHMRNAKFRCNIRIIFFSFVFHLFIIDEIIISNEKTQNQKLNFFRYSSRLMAQTVYF